MPFLINDKNTATVLNATLAGGETLLSSFGVPRRAVGITDKRFLVTNYPFFGKTKPIIDVALTDVTALDYRTKGNHVFVDVTPRGGETQSVKLQAYVDDVAGLLRALLEKARELAPGIGGPTYFGEGEQELVSVPVKKGMFRGTNQNIYFAGSKLDAQGLPDPLQKIAIADVRSFDFYETSGLKLGRIVVESANGLLVLEIAGMATAMTQEFQLGVHDERWPLERFAKTIPDKRPDYLSGERLLFSSPASQSEIGSAFPGCHLRLTDLRILLLNVEKDGRLTLIEAQDRAGLGGAKITQHQGEHRNFLSYEVVFENGFRFFATNQEAVDAIMIELRK